MSRRIDLTKKKKIIDAARKLFSEHDYKDITIERIARKAGIGKGTVYLYFKNKDEVYFGIMEKSTLEAYYNIRKVIKEYPDFYAALRESVRSLVAHFSVNIDLFRIMQKGQFNSRNVHCGLLKKKMMGRMKKMVMEISKIFCLKNTPKLKMTHLTLAQYLLSAITASIHSHIISAGSDRKLEKSQTMADRVTDMFLYGAVARKHGETVMSRKGQGIKTNENL